MRAKYVLFFSALLMLSGSDVLGNEILFRNVIKNQGAEDGAASVDGQTVVLIPDWVSTGSVTIVSYDTPGDFPAQGDSGPADRGNKLFVGGPGEGPVVTLSQEIVIPPNCNEFHQSHTLFEARAWLGGFSDQEDYAEVQLQFLGDQDDLLWTVAIGPVTAADRDNVTGLRFRGAAGDVPGGTAKVIVTVTLTRFGGDYNNAFVDALELRFITPLQVEGATWGRMKSLFR